MKEVRENGRSSPSFLFFAVEFPRFPLETVTTTTTIITFRDTHLVRKLSLWHDLVYRGTVGGSVNALGFALLRSHS